MGLEIERKFLVKDSSYKKDAKKIFIRQGFLNDDMNRLVRIRIAGEKAFITIKGPSEGMVRREFEYTILKEDAEIMIRDMCIPPLLIKNRFMVDFEGMTWEIDEFLGENEGLVVAEVEIPSTDYNLKLPPWVGVEVTGQTRYYNASLVKNPYKLW
jgi:adenylate cyclase